MYYRYKRLNMWIKKVQVVGRAWGHWSWHWRSQPETSKKMVLKLPLGSCFVLKHLQEPPINMHSLHWWGWWFLSSIERLESQVCPHLYLQHLWKIMSPYRSPANDSHQQALAQNHTKKTVGNMKYNSYLYSPYLQSWIRPQNGIGITVSCQWPHQPRFWRLLQGSKGIVCQI